MYGTLLILKVQAYVCCSVVGISGVASLSIGSGPSDPRADTAKRIRALQKKIGQIEGLKVSTTKYNGWKSHPLQRLP